MSLVLDLAKMVLAVQKHLKITKMMIILKNSYYYYISKKIICWEVFDLGPQLDVFGAGLGQDGSSSLETPKTD